MIDIGLYVGYILLLGAVLVAVALPLVNAFSAPKVLVRMAMALVSFALLFAISFLFSGSEVTNEYIAKGVGERGSRLIGAGLIMFYIVFAVALLGIVLSQIAKIFRR